MTDSKPQELYAKLNDFLPLGVTVGGAILSILAISTVHLAGFLTSVPDNLQQVVVVNFADTFIGLFYFYVAISLILSKVIVSFIYVYEFSLLNVAAKVGINRKIILRKPIVQASIFVFIYLSVYHETPLRIAIWLIDYLYRFFLTPSGLFVSLAVLLLIPLVWRVIAKSEDAYGSEQELQDIDSKEIGAIVGVIMSILLAAAFASGIARGHFLWLNNPIVIQDGRIAGRFNVVLQSGDGMILIEHNSFFDRHIILTPSAIFYEIVNTAGIAKDYSYPWFPPYSETTLLDSDGNSTDSIRIEYGEKTQHQESKDD